MEAINIWAVLGSVVLACILGTLWYGPIFGKQWMHLMGITHESMEEMKKKGGSMGKSYGIMIAASLVEAYVLAYLIKATGTTDSSMALQLGFWIWLGFVASIGTGIVSWEGKPWKLFWINTGYQLVSILMMSLVLVNWQ